MSNRFEDASKTLRAEREHLIADFLKGKEPDFLARNARILDDYFRESFERSMVGPRIGMEKNPYAIIALGGYGREEECLHSDVDLLFLFRKTVPPAANELIREIVYPLWDLGLQVGHAVRSLKECISLGEKDDEVLTSLLDARFICGISLLFTELLDQIREKIIGRKSEKIVLRLIERNRARHAHFGDSSYLLEPNLKEGRGGLRDYHTMLWIARIKSNLKQPRDLEYFGFLSYSEYQGLRKSLSFIWQARNALHFVTGRKCDQLHFEHQTRLADLLEFKGAAGQQPVERFLSELHGGMEFVKQQHRTFLHEIGYPGAASRVKRRAPKPEHLEGFEISREMLHFNAAEEILGSPELMARIFEESSRRNLPLSAEARRLVREFSFLIDSKFRSAPEVVRAFENALLFASVDGEVLDEMLVTGFLVRFIPEFRGILNRIQYDEYHLYPVDKHAIRSVQTLKMFLKADAATSDTSLLTRLMKELSRHQLILLIWATLLHDIGKGEEGENHSLRGARMVREILARIGYPEKDAETVAFLVEEHLLLIKTATRRDINDEQTAIQCARKIKEPALLKMLYLLTAADSISTGPKAWNDWISALLRDFFLKVLGILEKGELATEEAIERVERKISLLMKMVPEDLKREDVSTLLNAMAPRYLLYTSPDEILSHVRLYRDLKNEDAVWSVERNGDANTRTVTVCAKDRPGLFSKIAGVFTLNSIDILAAKIYTWRNNVALDIFEVRPPIDPLFEAERWERAQKQLKAALAGTLDLKGALSGKLAGVRIARPPAGGKSHRIVVDNKSSSFFTLVEVFAYDFPGLLFNITDALFRCGLDIWVAKIATNTDQVVDVFYVRDLEREKVDDPERVKSIQEAVAAVLPENATELLSI